AEVDDGLAGPQRGEGGGVAAGQAEVGLGGDRRQLLRRVAEGPGDGPGAGGRARQGPRGRRGGGRPGAGGGGVGHRAASSGGGPRHLPGVNFSSSISVLAAPTWTVCLTRPTSLAKYMVIEPVRPLMSRSLLSTTTAVYSPAGTLTLLSPTILKLPLRVS